MASKTIAERNRSRERFFGSSLSSSLTLFTMRRSSDCRRSEVRTVARTRPNVQLMDTAALESRDCSSAMDGKAGSSSKAFTDFDCKRTDQLALSVPSFSWVTLRAAATVATRLALPLRPWHASS